MDGALAVWLGFLAVVIGVTTVWRVIRAGRDDGADARSLGLVTADAPDAQPMSTVRVQVSESGPMPFGYRRCTLEVHPSALVFRGSRVDPLVIPRDRIGCIELKPGPTGSRATVFDASGRRSALSFIAGGARIRDALSAGGALGLIDGA